MTKIIATCIFVSLLCTTLIKAQEKSIIDTTSVVFETVEAPLHPPKGIKNFKLQWINYLDSLNQAGVLTNKNYIPTMYLRLSFQIGDFLLPRIILFQILFCLVS